MTHKELLIKMQILHDDITGYLDVMENDIQTLEKGNFAMFHPFPPETTAECYLETLINICERWKKKIQEGE